MVATECEKGACDTCFGGLSGVSHFQRLSSAKSESYSRKDLIRNLRKFGYVGLYPAGIHMYMHEISSHLLAKILK